MSMRGWWLSMRGICSRRLVDGWLVIIVWVGFGWVGLGGCMHACYVWFGWLVWGWGVSLVERWWLGLFGGWVEVLFFSPSFGFQAKGEGVLLPLLVGVVRPVGDSLRVLCNALYEIILEVHCLRGVCCIVANRTRQMTVAQS